MNAAEVKEELKSMRELRVAGSILTLAKARKAHKCLACGMPIEPGATYYTVIQGGGGLGWIKFPDRVHIDCVEDYLSGVGGNT